MLNTLDFSKGQFLWIVFTLIFVGFAIFHFIQARKSVKKPKNYAGVKTINGVQLGIAEFINDFRSYIDNLNKDNKKMNIITGVNYLIAALTAIYSYYLSVL